jgi:hypothetical protein
MYMLDGSYIQGNKGTTSVNRPVCHPKQCEMMGGPHKQLMLRMLHTGQQINTQIDGFIQ